MVTIFNRKEVMITMSLEVRQKIQDILSANQIEYVITTRNLQGNRGIGSATRARTGTAFINTDYSYEYKIYVRREDYERAMMLIRKS